MKVEDLIKKAVISLQAYFANCLSNPSERIQKSAKLVAYWVCDYIRFLESEPKFKGRKWKKYKRGDVLKVHLGYRIGTEEGGLHYAIVLDTNNDINSGTITVVPLTSVKPGVDVKNLGKDRLFLGSELHNLLDVKIRTQILLLTKQITSDSGQDIEEIEKILQNAKRTQKELAKLKMGSIALLGQIVTVSKIRIYDPLSSSNTLHGIRISDDKLDEIDSMIKKLYIKN